MAYRTERVFVLTAILLVGLGLVLAISRGAVVEGGASQNALLLWIMTFALMLVASAGALWLTAGASTASQDSLLRARLWFLPIPLETVLPGLLAVGFVL